MTELLTSLNNPKIKNVVKLQQKSAERKAQNLTVVEGLREIKQALNSGLVCHSAFICEKIACDETVEFMSNSLNENSIYFISDQIFEKLAYRDNSDGVIVLIDPQFLSLDEIILTQNPLILILESVEKPGNLGALLRTADAAGVDAILVCDEKTDLFNPNTIRASLGAIFSKQVVTCTDHEAMEWLRNHHIAVFSAALPSETGCYDVDLTRPAAIVMGSEANGLSKFWIDQADEVIMIPMFGKVDSLNVSASAAIILYEAVRQRLGSLK